MVNTNTYGGSSPQTPQSVPPQHQNTQPGSQLNMQPKPITDNPQYKGSGKMAGRVAVITGGDSGIGQAVAIAFAKEGADVAVLYLNENQDARDTQKMVESQGRHCLLVPCDLKSEQAAFDAVNKVVQAFQRVDVLVNNAAVQYPQNSIEDITTEQLGVTFNTNVMSYFSMAKACLKHMKPGSQIINTTSVTAFAGNKTLIDYSATKGAVSSFTKSLALSLVEKGIRVNAVAPGPVWTPLIPASFSAEDVAKFGKDTPIGRAAQPFELAPTYVYLACDDSAYVTGQVLHVNGGKLM